MRRNNINPTPVEEKGQHPPIISEETWDKAKAILEKRSHTPNRVHSGEYILTGILKCPVCGSSMVLGRTTNRKKDGSKRVLEYYVCGNWKNKGTAACKSNGIRVEEADEYVLSKISKFSSSDKLIKDVVKRINNGSNNKMGPIQQEYQHLKKLALTINDKRDKVLSLYEDGVISREVLADRIAKLNEEKVLLEERLVPLDQQLNQSSYKNVSFDMVKEVMTGFVKNYKETITSEQRKHLLQLIIRKITISISKEIESIQIQLNNDVVRHFTNGEEESSNDDFSSPFLVLFEIE